MNYLVLAIIGWLMVVVGKIWAIVSLLGWLFNKFDNFNWLSVGLFILGYIVLFRAYIKYT